jgi:ComF family protein
LGALADDEFEETGEVHRLGGADDDAAQVFYAKGDAFDIAGTEVDACELRAGEIGLTQDDVGEGGAFKIGTSEGGLPELGGADLAAFEAALTELGEAGIAVVEEYVLPAAAEGVHADELAFYELDTGRLEAAEHGVRKIAADEADIREADRGDLAVGEGDALEEQVASSERGQPALREVEVGEAGIFERDSFEERFHGGAIGVGGRGKTAWRLPWTLCFLGFFGHGFRLPLRRSEPAALLSAKPIRGLDWRAGRDGLILRAWRGPTDLERQRVRCVFSESLNGSTLDISGGAPSGSLSGGPPGGVVKGRAVARMWQSSGATAIVARTVLNDLVATLFPADCRTCNKPLLRASLSPVCDACLSKIKFQSMTLCWRCGEALGMESDRFAGQFQAADLLCTPCRIAPPQFERAAAFSVYADELRAMVHLLKYDRIRAMAKPLGAMLAQAVETLKLAGEVTVIAVPLYPAKERQRGYNQSGLLADEAASTLRNEASLVLRVEHGLLHRVRDTESQFELTPHARRTNLRGAFAVQEGASLAGRTVLLVDDIYTTGATARECARVLRRAGAERVFVATLARAQTELVERWDLATENRALN